MHKIFVMCKKYLKSHISLLVIYIALCVGTSLFSMAMPYITGSFIDRLIKAVNADFLWYYCGLFAALNIAQTLIGYVSGRMYIHLQMNMGFEFNKDTVEHVQKTSLTYTDRQDTAYLSQRINNDTNNLIIFCIGLIQNIIINALSIAVPFAILYYFNRQIAFLVMGLTAIYVLVYYITKKPIYKINLAFQEAQSQYFSKLHEQLSHIKFIKVQAIASAFIRRLEQSFQILLSMGLKRQKISYIFSGLDGLIAVLMQIILFLVGGVAVINKSLTIGQFTIISTYFYMLLSSARYFFNLGKNIQETNVAYARLQEIELVQEQHNGHEVLSDIHSIKLDNITFGYGGNNIFTSYSYEFKRGNIYAITGVNGSGKTTLISLLLGLYIGEHSGQIYYNGIAEESIDMVTVRKKLIGVTEQESTLLSDTIGYNISLNEAHEISQTDIQELIALFGMQQYMAAQTEGLESKINYSADNISGGEKQKLALIRTLLKNPSVLILDEPTSAMDSDSNKKFCEYLLKKKEDKIIIVVTHDSAITRICDAQIVL